MKRDPYDLYEMECRHNHHDREVAMTKLLHCFSNSCDTVVAYDEEDAIMVWEKTTGESWETDYADSDEWVQESDEEILVIADDYREKVSHTYREWADLNGRGFLCSSEY